MQSRRKFIHQAGAAAGMLSLAALQNKAFAAGLMEQVKRIEHLSPEDSASDTAFWGWIRSMFSISDEIINLNNGGVSPQPKDVQDAMIRHYKKCNEGPSYFMWRILDQGREPLRKKLATLAGCLPDEIAINRNSSEAIETVIFGLNLKAGDEVILTKQDYPNMINAWKQRELRDGIKLVWLNFNLPEDDDEKIVSEYVNAFTEKTKIAHVTHIINWTGQIMPARKIADEAHKRNIEVLLDAAHSFAHIDFKMPDTGCDYAGTSLHKWLCAPFGSGMLYIKKEKIKNIWPLLANDNPHSEDIKKFETLGTRSFPIEQAISQAIDFHIIIGPKRKEERLKYLKNYWTQQVKDIEGLKFYTSFAPEKSCAITNVGITGMKTGDFEMKLFEKYKIHTSPIVWENIDGVRITPHVYTSLADLDILVKGIREIATTHLKK